MLEPRKNLLVPGRVHAHLLGMNLGEAAPCEDPGGWPEFEITLRYFVTSEDPEAIETARRRVYKHVTDVAVDDLSEYLDG